MATSTIKAQNLIVDSVTTESKTVSGNGNASYTVDVTKTGYKALALVGSTRSGGGSGLLADAGGWVDVSQQTATFSLYNPTSTARTGISVTLLVLYEYVGG